MNAETVSPLYLFVMDPTKAEIPPPKLMAALRGFNLLPAIVFLPTRRRCDEAASEVAADKSQRADAERQKRRKEIFDEFAEEFPEVLDHKRGLSIAMIRRLHAKLGIPAEVLIRPSRRKAV